MSKKRTSRHKSKIDFLEDVISHNGDAKREGPKRKTWSVHDLKTIKPLTPRQEELFHAFFNFEHLCAIGTAGTGKTFLALFLALNEILNPSTPQNRIIIVRSIVPTRDVGFLPGDLSEKVAVYESPYRDICAELIGRASTYDDMKEAGLIQFMPTSFVRGLTWDDAIVIVDECQNMTWSEIDSVVTRLGRNSRLILCGDKPYQNDLGNKSGIDNLIKIVESIGTFGVVNFTKYDIVRSEFVKSWICAREDLRLTS